MGESDGDLTYLDVLVLEDAGRELAGRVLAQGAQGLGQRLHGEAVEAAAGEVVGHGGEVAGLRLERHLLFHR